MLVPTSERLDDLSISQEQLDAARLSASRQLREAINLRYVCPDDLDGFPEDIQGRELRALVEQHGVALAAYALSQHDGGRSRKIDGEQTLARDWMARVKKGELDLSSVLERRVTQSSGLRQLITIEGCPPSLPDGLWTPRAIE